MREMYWLEQWISGKVATTTICGLLPQYFLGNFDPPSQKLMEPITLTLGQKFEIEKFSREIDNSKDVQELRSIAKGLLVAWQQQQAASAWAIRQSLNL